jgi:AraC family transcriptional regulator
MNTRSSNALVDKPANFAEQDKPSEHGRAGTLAFRLGTEGRQKYPVSRLLASSADRGWSTISAELRSHAPGTIRSSAQHHVEVVIALEGSSGSDVIRNGAGRSEKTCSRTGSVWLVPIGIGDEELTITAPLPKALHLYLPAGQFSVLADQYNFVRSPAYSLPYIGGFSDELIVQIGRSIFAELMDETATGQMFAETSSLMLAARLSHDYADSSFVNAAGANADRLDNARLRRVLDHIEEHLEEDISVGGLANLANLSSFHFTRMFTAAMGISPARYVSSRRLKNAMAMLAIGKLPLSEIAHRSCFSSQASFNRAFRRATGVSPGEYRRRIR